MRTCPGLISCVNCRLGRRCAFADVVSVPLDPPRESIDDGTSLESMFGYSEGEGRGTREPRYLISDEPEE